MRAVRTLGSHTRDIDAHCFPRITRGGKLVSTAYELNGLHRGQGGRPSTYRWIRKTLTLLVALFLAVAATVVIVVLSVLRLGAATSTGEVTAKVESPVTISRDAVGMVTIHALNRSDASFALGFVHAQDDFFAMDLMRRKAAGELAELIGPAAVDTDKDYRRHRLRAVTEEAYRKLPADQRMQLERYAAGVNAGLAALRIRPWEYLLFRQKPRAWLPEDCLLVVGAMYLELNGGAHNERELRLLQLNAVLPASVVAYLTAPDPSWEASLDGSHSDRPPLPRASAFTLPRQTGTDVAMLVNMRHLAVRSSDIGSNAFAVAGDLGADHHALLANDMHLSLSVPNIWYRVKIVYRQFEGSETTRQVEGVSLPGTPALVAGENGNVAWGFTNSYADVQDWVKVDLIDPHGKRYRTPEGIEDIYYRDESINVRGAAAVHLHIAETRWGPIIGTSADGKPMALAWTGASPHAYNMTVMELEGASDVHAALDIAQHSGIPLQNFLAADRDGHIGWTIAGNTIPIRGSAGFANPADWSVPGAGWTGWADASAYPKVENPVQGYLWSANNRAVGGAPLALLGDGGYDLGARAKQIRDDLGGHHNWTATELLKVQLDDRAVFLARWQHLFLTVIKAAEKRHAHMDGLTSLYDRVERWGANADAASPGYGLVRRFHENVTSRVLRPFVELAARRFKNFEWPDGVAPEGAVWELIHGDATNLLDPRYKNWNDLLDDACVATLQQAQEHAQATWGDENTLDLEHPLSGIFPDFVAAYLNAQPKPLSGDRDMPFVSASDFGASERMVAVPGDASLSLMHMPGGQTDHPLAPAYLAGTEEWRLGEPTPLQPGPAKSTFQLVPNR